MTQRHFDVAIVGGGILGLAHAWRAATRGLRVALFERNARATGASIRNFGMVWPIGQPFGERFALALQSRELWFDLARQADFWINPCGSLHIAHREDEWSVLCEFHELAKSHGIELGLLDAAQTNQATQAVNSVGLIGSLQSPFEVAVNPIEVISSLPTYLSQRHSVELLFQTPIASINNRTLSSFDGRAWTAEQVIVCGGDDVQTLFPQAFAVSGLKRCKLQMMKTEPQPGGWRLNAHLASGLTLRHYQSFNACASLQELIERVHAETPELDQFGIHVMASQNQFGEVILGDSHEYDADIPPFDSVEIDELILRELKKQFHLLSWKITNRWYGIYLKNTLSHVFECSPQDNVHIITGVGGAGMTLSFGLAEQTCNRLFEKVGVCR